MALPALASTLTTVAVLLPVVLLAGLAKKLFAPLALTVAVAMIAGYVVSMLVTPVACRYFLGHDAPGRAGASAVVERASRASPTATRGVLRAGAAVRAGGSSPPVALLVVAARLAAARLPSTFFPEIDESMERVYVRLAPGTSLRGGGRAHRRHGRGAARRSCPRARWSWCSPTSGYAEAARAAR